MTPDQLALKPDVFVVGNVMSRGNPLVEALLDSGARYESGPEWLARNVLQDRWVLAVAGTHGKTTTTSLLTSILEHAGRRPVSRRRRAARFQVSARLGTAVAVRRRGGRVRHRVLRQAREVRALPAAHRVLNNLEHDHADIYPDVASIQRQFHLLMRIDSGAGARSSSMRRPPSGGGARHGVLDAGRALCLGCNVAADWHVRSDRSAATGASRSGGRNGTSARSTGGCSVGTTPRMRWPHSSRRTTRASTSRPRSRRCAVQGRASPPRGARHRERHRGLRRLCASSDGDRQHAAGIAARRGGGRVIAVLEPRSNTMKLGTHKQALVDSLRAADRVFVYQSPEVKWDVATAVAPLGALASVESDLARLTEALVTEARPGDHLVLMSNGSFGGLHERLLARTRGAPAAPEAA
jgi:UDP-N-acetylmuramate: L-alanyl-gamma-D-glutamyl-meso-diaminopimelate ligase